MVRRRLIGFAFLEELGPLYALYVVWFARNGLSPSDISALFVLWGVVGLVAEVPSGALADRIDRRRLLVFALVLRAVGVMAWLLWPGWWAFALGVVLWAVHTAFASGTWEALVYDQMRGEDGDTSEEAYAEMIVRADQASSVAVVLGIAMGTAGLALGFTIPWLCWVTLVFQVPAALLLLSLPAVHSGAGGSGDADEEPLTLASWWGTLKTGVRASTSSGLLARMLLIGALIEGLFILDDYQPVLAVARGASDVVVPALVLAVWVGVVVGGELGARWPRMHSRNLGLALVVSTSVVIAAVFSGSVAALAVLGVGYAVQYAAWVVSDARFQARIPEEVRATVSSVRGFLANWISIAAFGFVGLTTTDDPTWGLVPLLGLLVLTGLFIAAWLPEAATEESQSSPPRKAREPS